MSASVANLRTHPERGWPVDPETGTVYGARRWYAGKPLGTMHSRGYLVTCASGITFLLHRVVWETCVGPIPAGMVINHLNGVKTDNRLCNLEVVTQSENVRHAHATGLTRRVSGSDHPNHWITSEMRAGIRRMRVEGFNTTQTARAYGVSRKSVWTIEREVAGDE